MEHAFVQIDDSGGMGTGCSRCGATGADLAKPCSYVSDGAIYQGKPISQDEIDHLADALDGEEDREDLEAEMNCSMGPDGQCGQAGSEYCDLECPYRDGN